MNQQQTAVFRCHDADACVMGQKACPTPSICGCEVAACAVKEGGHKPAESMHQIQEPSAVEQAAWHAGLDEGRAQAAQNSAADVPASGAIALSEYLKTSEQHAIVPDVGGAFAFAFAAGFNLAASQAAPAAVAVPDGLHTNIPLAWADSEDDKPYSRADLERVLDTWNEASGALPRDSGWRCEVLGMMEDAYDLGAHQAALAATPAADAPLDFLPFSARAAIASRHGMKVTAEFNALVREVIAEYRARAVPSDIAAAAPVVLPEPDFHVRPASAVQPHRALMIWDNDATSEPAYFDRTVRALLATATGLPRQPHCGTCNDHGAVGNILTAEPCPDCTVPAIKAQADARDAAQEKPPAGRYVLAWMEGKEVPIRAMWVPKSWLVAGDECPEGWAEYDEDKDEYFCPEGWYEANEHEETHWHVGKPIIAWVELPRYAAIAAAKGE